MIKQEYCVSWFWANRSTSNPLTEIAARKRHEKRQEYTVAVGGFDKPTAIVEVVNDFVAVSFLDNLLREYMTVHFQEKQPQKLFLSMTTRRVYCVATEEMLERLRIGRTDPKHQWGQFLAEIDRVVDGHTLSFHPDGTTTHRNSRHGDARIVVEPGPPFDAGTQTEPYPEFGQYEHLLKRERGLPWENWF